LGYAYGLLAISVITGLILVSVIKRLWT
jgi:hypothetical protein